MGPLTVQSMPVMWIDLAGQFECLMEIEFKLSGGGGGGGV